MWRKTLISMSTSLPVYTSLYASKPQIWELELLATLSCQATACLPAKVCSVVSSVITCRFYNWQLGVKK